jgi:hypothetical protein
MTAGGFGSGIVIAHFICYCLIEFPTMFVFFQEQSSNMLWGYIPAVLFSGIISGIVGALIALYATKLQNQAHAQRQKESLEHEANQRKLEREMNLRREIFLSGIEAVGKMQQYLLTFADMSHNPQTRSELLVGTNEALSKVAVIAEFQTIQALEKIENHHREAVVLLIEKRTEMDFNLQLKTNNDQFIQATLQRNQQLIQFLQESGNKKLPTDVVNAIHNELNANSAEITRKQKTNDRIVIESIDQLINLTQLCFQSFSISQQLGAEAIICARRELGFPIDEIQYKALVAESSTKAASQVSEQLKELIEKYKNLLEIENDK